MAFVILRNLLRSTRFRLLPFWTLMVYARKARMHCRGLHLFPVPYLFQRSPYPFEVYLVAGEGIASASLRGAIAEKKVRATATRVNDPRSRAGVIHLYST